MTRRKLLFLDVDGVINADVPKSAWPDKDEAKVVFNHGGGYRVMYKIRWSPTMVAELASLVDGLDLRVHWVTTWCENLAVRNIEKKIGWVPADSIVHPYWHDPKINDGPEYTEWKLHAVVQELEAGDTAVWVDDDAVPDHREAAAARVGARLLMIAPTEAVGLTPRHLEEIRKHFAS